MEPPSLFQQMRLLSEQDKRATVRRQSVFKQPRQNEKSVHLATLEPIRYEIYCFEIEFVARSAY